MPKPFAFVLMPFQPEFKDTYVLGIKPACEEAGYYCERLDEQIFEETMLERIYNQIAKADIVIADLTGRNANVFYETGYAHALGKRVILLTRNADDIPFDLKHHFHIIYSTGIAYLKEKLRERTLHYLLNPAESTTDPFKLLALIANGTSLNLEDSTSSVTVPFRWVDIRSGIKTAFLNLSAHLAQTALNEEMDFSFRLITPKIFSSCGWILSEGSTQIYTTIEMPNGELLHKPLSNVSLRPNDPELIAFHLNASTWDEIVLENLVTLRIMARGLTKDVRLKIVLEEAS